jgi:uncharacterized protein (TIGR03067 family)
MKLEVLVLLVTGLVMPSEARAPRAERGQPTSLQGEWQLESTRDEKHTDAGCERSRMIVKADGTVIFQVAGRTMNQAELRLGSGTERGSLDLTLADGQVIRGVYVLKRDELTICFTEAGQVRPTGTSPKGPQWAESWKRVKR